MSRTVGNLPFERAALIKLGYSCNNRCVFCHVGDKRILGGNLSTREALERIQWARSQGCDGVVFSGGEPTIRKDLAKLVQSAFGMGMAVGIVTNARMLSYTWFTQELVKSGLKYALVSLHSANRSIHDRLVDVHGAFEQTTSGLRNLVNEGLQFLAVNAVLTEYNLADLVELVNLVSEYPGVMLKASLMEPKGFGADRLDELVPDPWVARKAVLSAAATADDLGVVFQYDGFPRCYPGAFDLLDSHLETHGIRFMVETWESALSPVDRGERCKPSQPCSRCVDAGSCPGIYSGYEGTAWQQMLEPKGRGVPNSILLSASGETSMDDGAPTGDAPMGDGGLEPTVILAEIEPGRIVSVPVANQDFSRETMEEAIGSGQVYAMVHPHENTLDKQVVQLVADLEKNVWRMPERNEETVFDKELAAIKHLISRLEGRILDIGSGRDPGYMEIVEKRMKDAGVEYWAVDPVLEPCSKTNIKLIGSRLEHADLPEKYFDTILAFRCLNHVDDPVGALLSMHKALKPGGMLVVSEDVPFVVISDHEPYRGRQFEHHQNMSARDVRELAESLGFEQRMLEEPAPGRSPSYMMTFIKSAGSPVPTA